MNEKHTQLEFVLGRLKKNGQVSRNDCLKHFITRLGSRIYDLRQDGYEFEIKRVDGDYVYVLTKDPSKEPRQMTLASL